MCCFAASQVRDTEKPIADTLGVKVSDVNVTSWSAFDSRGEEVVAKDRRRFSASTDNAWNIEYLIAAGGINDTVNIVAKLNDSTFLNEVGNGISASMNIVLQFIFTRNVSVVALTFAPTLAPSESPTQNIAPTSADSSANRIIPIILVILAGIGFLIISICALIFDCRAIKKGQDKPINEQVVPPTSTNI